MKYLFKIVCVDRDGVAGFEVFRMDDGSYKCMQASWKGYMHGPGNLVLKGEKLSLARYWTGTPQNHSCEKQLIDCIIEYEGR